MFPEANLSLNRSGGYSWPQCCPEGYTVPPHRHNRQPNRIVPETQRVSVRSCGHDGSFPLCRKRRPVPYAGTEGRERSITGKGRACVSILRGQPRDHNSSKGLTSRGKWIRALSLMAAALRKRVLQFELWALRQSRIAISESAPATTLTLRPMTLP